MKDGAARRVRRVNAAAAGGLAPLRSPALRSGSLHSARPPAAEYPWGNLIVAKGEE
jgi:hypothetical protein